MTEGTADWITGREWRFDGGVKTDGWSGKAKISPVLSGFYRQETGCLLEGYDVKT